MGSTVSLGCCPKAPHLTPPPLRTQQDMDAVARRHSTTTLQLRFTFMRGLHPFYPPRVEVVRPHLASPLLGALCSHPMLRLANWDPWRPMEEVVGSLKAFLENHGRVVCRLGRGLSSALRWGPSTGPARLAAARPLRQTRDMHAGRAYFSPLPLPATAPVPSLLPSSSTCPRTSITPSTPTPSVPTIP
jgi:hypothetical protein